MSKMRKTRKAVAGIGAMLALLLILTLSRIYVVSSHGGATVLHPTADGNVSLFTSFEGASGPGYKDHPDASGAVGPNHVVDFTGSVFIVHEKKTGIVLEKLTQGIVNLRDKWKSTWEERRKKLRIGGRKSG